MGSFLLINWNERSGTGNTGFGLSTGAGGGASGANTDGNLLTGTGGNSVGAGVTGAP